MPRVKIEYVISFSSEDPEQPASSLVRGEVGGRKWLCAAGDSAASVVLQLERAVQISAIEVGAYNAAMVEVLASRSEAPDHAEVLVPRAVLLSPAESRRGERLDRVRSFTGPALAPAAARRWDRLRLLCLQPYARNTPFGLSFVHVFEPESAAPVPPVPVPATLAASDDDDEFSPGELFAAHRRSDASVDTGAQIRRASRALESAARASPAPSARPSSDRSSSDRPPPARAPSPRPPSDRPRDRPDDDSRKRGADERRPHDVRPPKRRADASARGEADAGAGVLAGVVFALSGYENPRRGAVRAAACALGASARRDWAPDCTHLVCAFPNTPKLRAARAAAGGALRAVRAEWLEECARARALLPWRWFATCAADRVSPPPPAASDSDTDDDIERVRRAAPADDWESARTDSEGESEERGGGARGRLRRALAGRRVRALDARLARLLTAYGADVVHDADEPEVRVRGHCLRAALAAPH